MTRVILPGATIGILGSGQLGRMLALAARRMGYKVHVLGPDSGSPAGQIADREVVAAHDDADAVAELAAGVDVITFEFENVDAKVAAAAAAKVPVHPSAEVLSICQNRLREKTWLASRGFPTAAFRPVISDSDLEPASREVGFPGVLKTAGSGYDGKGQRKVHSAAEAAAARTELGGDLVWERFVDFELEVSVIGARSARGAFVSYGPVENRHSRHVLDLTLAPAALDPEVAGRARELARAILDELGVVGVLCVELFVTRDRGLLVNELAPRPHNSGHYTIEACGASQFEQQLRAVCGLPLGDPAPRAAAAMANLMGDLWFPQGPHGSRREPAWQNVLARPGVHLHLYGKRDPRPGRKMGHLTLLASAAETAGAGVLAARQLLTRG